MRTAQGDRETVRTTEFSVIEQRDYVLKVGRCYAVLKKTP